MNSGVYTEAQRARMNGLYSRLRAASLGSFLHDGLIYMGVPAWVVKAYVEAGETPGVDRAAACIGAHWGVEAVRRFKGDADWLGWRIGRAWAWKLGDIEAGLAAQVAA